MKHSNKERERNTSGKLGQGSGSAFTGVFLILFGSAFLLKNLGTNLPSWLFRWEVLLFIAGAFLAVKNNFRGAGWFIMMVIGGTSMLDIFIPAFNKPQLTWSVVAILVGLYFVLRPKESEDPYLGVSENDYTSSDVYSKDKPSDVTSHDLEVLDIAAVFGNVKKIVMAKNFKGGEAVAVFGGTFLDLRQADIHGVVQLEVTNIMGGSKLIIPSNWEVRSEMVAVFGGVEDKRNVHDLAVDTNKLLILKGVCLFGGLEVRNY